MMMRKNIIYMMMLLIASSCVRKLDDTSVSYGVLSLAVASEVEVDVATRATVDCSGYMITFVGAHTGNGPYESSILYGEMGAGYVLPYGIYTISAESCSEADAVDGLGCARYSGSASGVVVKSPEGTSAEISCTMVNSRASVTFDAGFLSDFESVRAELEVADRLVAFTPDDVADRVAYFNVAGDGSSVLKYTIYGTIEGAQLSYTGSMPLKPAKHARITFKSNHNGIIGPDTVVDGTVGTVEIPGYIEPGTGDDLSGGIIEVPVIYVDYEINDAVVLDCIIDVID